MVTVNGENLDIAGLSINDWLSKTEYDKSRIVVELNMEIVSKGSYNDVVLKDGDSVEVVSFVGGG
ncbi:sulfur carrier protein ThiS [Treponema sp.]|uniref:sulfur carrier protein ThiS n=1 Tax=Treponema sp. TaxID=166 RepID=UPI00298E9DCE|nr:sulfur carrier protein ThiS [Treponema sp.]MCR5613470.1 sulfur carrier protein ThiS [Treponema sp.]